ncbi:MAG: 2-(3-amino-3-carboxypropyl)histidine synthase subunit 1/2 [Nitrosopumilus sp.]|nr:2-(3-amino-3-carboxypropyl)histidine synthase subunit 1/2 [Nitrosopumilus sp.]MDA7959829.1 2-(3-amino-3-carboxypropyl)histidine synthase subunit 1/2 [Nitrosopumilus sp.]
MIRVDVARMLEIIREEGPASVSLNGPDGMLTAVQEAAVRISGEAGIPAYVIADTTWGSCDLNEAGARAIGADIHFNIGHTINVERLGSTYMIDAFDDVRFDRVAAECAARLAGRRAVLVTDSQHLREIGRVREILGEGGVDVAVGPGGGQLNDGQVFGCEFYPATDAAGGADACVFMGQSGFHAAGVALATGLPTYALDPYFGEVRDVSGLADRIQRRATLAAAKAAEASSFGIIVGLRDGQTSKVSALRMKKELEAAGRRVQMFAMTDITNERLRNLSGIEAFIQSACPRISTDNSFDMPVLSMPQARAMLEIIRGREAGPYLRARHWL